MPEKIKIAYLDYSPHFAGAERALCTIISNLNRDLFDPIIIFPYPREHHKRYDVLGCEKIYLCDRLRWWMGSDYWKNPIRGSDFLKRTILGIRLAKVLVNRGIHILHVNLLRPDCLMWLLPCKYKNIHIIGHFRSFPLSWVPSRAVQQACDVIISVSHIVRDHAMLKYRHKNNVVIYDSVSPFQLDNRPRKDIISSVGALFPNKGHDNAIRAFALIADRFPEYELHIVGGGNDNELHRLQGIVDQCGISQKVHFSGKQVDNMGEVYEESKLVLSLTKEGEAFGLVPFEAAVCNTPTIAPNKGAIKEILQDGISAILVETEDVKAIAEKIDWALTHYDQCKQICQRARGIVENRLSPKIMDSQIMEIYSMLSGN